MSGRRGGEINSSTTSSVMLSCWVPKSTGRARSSSFMEGQVGADLSSGQDVLKGRSHNREGTFPGPCQLKFSD